MEFNLAVVAGAIADAVPDRDFYVQGSVRLTYGEFMQRSYQVANALAAHGMGCHVERNELATHESGQDHLALYLYNCAEFLESMLGAYAARVAPFNVNYRYTDDELLYLLRDQHATGVVFHSAFAPMLARVRPRLPDLRMLLQVPDESGNDLLAGAAWFPEAVAGQPTTPPSPDVSPDDLYVLCTGGTTGMPKGVLWRQADVFVAALGGASTGTGREYTSIEEIVAEAMERGDKFRNMSTAPFMHGAAQWFALTALTHGNRFVGSAHVRSFDAADTWSTVARERVTMLQIVGDAFAVPLLDELDQSPYDLDSLKFIMNSGATLSERSKQRFIEHLPHVRVGDALGTSEAGATGTATSTASRVSTGVFDLNPGVCVLAADLTRPLQPKDEDEIGWMAICGRIPLGYFGDPDKTASTFPIVGGSRYVVTGDRGRLLADGRMEFLGRDSVTINSGGEKVFAEEVEQALLAHPAVADVVVCGRPSERWGSEVVAVVAFRPGASATSDELLAAAAIRLARYKLPKAFVVREAIERSPAGKPDYRWAAAQAAASPIAGVGPNG